MSDYISVDIVDLILRLLPAKTLLRFRCVCKGWKGLIDSPMFMHDHLAVQNPTLIVHCESHEILSVDPHTRLPSVDTLTPPMVSERMGMLGTLHGVVCVIDWERQFLIWNPSIRKSSSVPLPDEFRWEDYSSGWEDQYGFWIDPCTKEFKVLMLLFFTAPVQFDPIWGRKAFLYSSGESGWRVIPPGDLPGWELSHCFNTPVMIGDVAHWVGWYGEVDDEGQEHAVRAILSFDFRLESFERVEIPSLWSVFYTMPCCWQGKLSFFRCDSMSDPRRWSVYSIQEGNSWVQVFSFDLLAPAKCVLLPLEGIGEMHENVRVFARIEDELVLFDTTTGGISPVKCGLRKSYLRRFDYGFVESLLFP